MPFSVNIIKLLDKVESPIREVLIEILAEIERQRKQWEESVTKKEFNELKEIVAELAKAQKETEQRLNELTQRVSELAEAQKRSEERITKLEKAVAELAEAQKKTEQRLNELAEAQKRTEEELRKLIVEHKKTREELGGLSHTVGYILEDKAFETLPLLLKKEYGIETEALKRDFIEISPNRFEEINIIGQGKRDGKKIWILGECKAQLKKRDVDKFLKKISRIEHIFPGEKLIILVAYQTSPQVKEYVREKGLRLYFSYELRRE